MRVLFRRALSDLWVGIESTGEGSVIRNSSTTRVLSGPADLTVTLPLEYQDRKGEDGLPVVLKDQTLMVIEAEDGSLQAGLVDDVRINGSTMTVSAGGLSSHPKGIPWTGPRREYIETDPLRVFRDVWDHLRAHPAAPQVVLSGATSTRSRVGRAETADHRRVRLLWEESTRSVKGWTKNLAEAETAIKTTTAALFKACGLSGVGKVKVADSGGRSDTTRVVWIDADDGNKAHVYKHFPARNVTTTDKSGRKRVTYKKAGHEWVAVTGVQAQVSAYLRAVKTRDEAKEKLKGHKDMAALRKQMLDDRAGQEADPYVLSWHETQDLAPVIEDMTLAGPFEYQEWARWGGEDRDRLVVGIEVGAPRIGVRRQGPDAPRFELGVNVREVPELTVSETLTEVRVYGAGEGSKMLAETREVDAPGRVRRVRTVTDKDAADRATVRRIADAELAAARKGGRLVIEQLVVTDHEHARPGTYGLGDEIFFTGRLVDGPDLAMWVRVLEIQDSFDGKQTLKVVTV